VKTDPTFWLLARASGMTAYVLLTASVAWGLALKSRLFARFARPAAVVDVHRFLAFTSLGALALHGVTLVLDHAVEIPWHALVVPGAAPYRPLWTSLGVIAGELMVVVYASFSLRRRIGARAWRTLHWTTYGVFAAATAHGLAAGTDSAEPWALGVYAAATGAVAGLAGWRFLTIRPKKRGETRVQVPPGDRPVAV